LTVKPVACETAVKTLARFWRDVGNESALPCGPSRLCSLGPERTRISHFAMLSRTRVRLSVKLTTGFADPRRHATWRRHPLFPSHQLCLGAPRSHQRTWVDKVGATPHQSSVFTLFRHHKSSGAHPSRPWRRVGKQNLRGRSSVCIGFCGWSVFSESRKQCVNATGPNGKSGGAQWRDPLFLYPSQTRQRFFGAILTVSTYTVISGCRLSGGTKTHVYPQALKGASKPRPDNSQRLCGIACIHPGLEK
jgi:hypothetical protein